MTVILQAEAIFRARDASGKSLEQMAARFRDISKAGKTVGEAVSGIGKQIADMQGKLARIDNFRALQTGLSEARQRFREAEREVQNLGRAMRDVERPTRQMEAAYRQAQRAVTAASEAYRQQAQAALAAKRGLEQSGMPISRLTQQQEQLRRSIEATTQQMQRQSQMMARGGPWGAVPRSASGVPLIPQNPSAAAAGDTRDGRGGRLLGAAGAVGGGLALRGAYDRVLEFEKSVAATKSRGELSNEDAAKLRANARQLGASGLGYTARDVAEIQRVYAQAGFEKFAAALARPTMDFMQFGDVAPDNAARYTVSALAAYGIKPQNEAEARKEAIKYQDIVAKGANLSLADVDDFAMGFKYAAPIASRLGISMEQISAMIASLIQSGQSGMEAGTAIRALAVRSIKPTADARQAMAEMGLRFEDYALGAKEVSVDDLSSGLKNVGVDVSSIRGRLQSRLSATQAAGGDVAEAMTDEVIRGLKIDTVEDKTKVSKMVARYVTSLAENVDFDRMFKDLQGRGMTAGQAARIFDSRQGNRLLALIAGGLYEDFLQKIQTEAPGSSARGAATMREGVLGSHNRLVSSFDNLILSLAESGVMDNVARGLEAVASGLKTVAETSPKLLEFGTYAAMAATGLGALTIALRPLALLAGAFGGGKAAAAGAAAALGAGASVPSMARFLPGGAAVAGGLLLGGAVGHGLANIHDIAAGKHWTPKTPDEVAGLKERLDEINARINGIESRTHPSMRGAFNPETDRLRQEAQGIQNRLNAVQVSGEATLKNDLKVTVEPSPLFDVRMREIAKEEAVRVPLQGANGPGSTGVSMPEATAPSTGHTMGPR